MILNCLDFSIGTDAMRGSTKTSNNYQRGGCTVSIKFKCMKIIMNDTISNEPNCRTPCGTTGTSKRVCMSITLEINT